MYLSWFTFTLRVIGFFFFFYLFSIHTCAWCCWLCFDKRLRLFVIGWPLPGVMPIPVFAFRSKLASATGVVPIAMKKFLFKVMPLVIGLTLIFQWYRRRRAAVCTGRARWTRTRRWRRTRWSKCLVRRWYNWWGYYSAVGTQTAVRTRIHTFRRSSTFIQLGRRKCYQPIETGTDAIVPVCLSICNVCRQLIIRFSANRRDRNEAELSQKRPNATNYQIWINSCTHCFSENAPWFLYFHKNKPLPYDFFSIRVIINA